jgi:hypothetical protein
LSVIGCNVSIGINRANAERSNQLEPVVGFRHKHRSNDLAQPCPATMEFHQRSIGSYTLRFRIYARFGKQLRCIQFHVCIVPVLDPSKAKFSGCFRFSASLAGLLWKQILSQKSILVGRIEFAKYNTIPVFICMIIGCLVIAGEVCIMY